MLRIHFTADDLARTRVALGPNPAWELVNSLQLLQNREGSQAFDPWRSLTRARLLRPAQSSRARVSQLTPQRAVQVLTTLCPHAEYFPDFLTPSATDTEVDASIDTILHTPKRRLAAELSTLAAVRGLPSWAEDIAGAKAAAMTGLGRALRAYWDAAVAPHLDDMRTSVDAERDRIARLVLAGGAEALLAGVSPAATWRAPVLELDYPLDQDLHLGGRGVTFIPSFFCWRMPVSLADPGLPPVVVYPLPSRRPQFGVHRPAHAVDQPLDQLLGSTRSAILGATRDGASTSELARTAGIAAATASHHTSVLRAAGLISSERRGSTMVHTIAPLGSALLARNRAS